MWRQLSTLLRVEEFRPPLQLDRIRRDGDGTVRVAGSGAGADADRLSCFSSGCGGSSAHSSALRNSGLHCNWIAFGGMVTGQCEWLAVERELTLTGLAASAADVEAAQHTPPR